MSVSFIFALTYISRITVHDSMPQVIIEYILFTRITQLIGCVWVIANLLSSLENYDGRVMDILFIYILNLFYYFFLVTTVNIFAGGWKWNIAVDKSGILPRDNCQYIFCRSLVFQCSFEYTLSRHDSRFVNIHTVVQ